jgi:hypothetical protein
MQLDCHPILIELMHNQVKHKVKPQNKRQGHWLDAPGLALFLLGVNTLNLCWLRCFLGSLLRVAYRKYARMRHQPKCNEWGSKSEMLLDYAQPTHTNPYQPYTNLPLAFLVF